MSSPRILHYVFKIGNRSETARFYRDVLGMKILRHEEFTEGCKAACNGPYDGTWSKSMVGYGPEDDHFVLELTYNYGLGSYTQGNSYQGINIESNSILDQARKADWVVEKDGSRVFLSAPDGYKFYIQQSEKDSTVTGISLSCSNLDRSVTYWTDLCGMTLKEHNPGKNAVLQYAAGQAYLELVQIEKAVDHASAGGRIAFSCPTQQLPEIERKMKENEETILTPLVRLDTPGKASVEVVILADPDGHEICFVGDEAFRELSQVDAKADSLLNEALAADKSNEWYAKKGKSKPSAS
ncbi:hypothetical protein CAPTEDRAFT_224395 [Capitella teleta]|uniref:VOC domain-containing protein n=1 Tax=Capitella teleta TaxID=283909 RepID=R7USM7_CAPTE|nr:hypothetical protein CAPTEDRAFT_224395 [Capitella teleta]|eukprot:ELU09205.1 hypothetical protein CAPTEDRAFT_224395 [Capitella teleta]